ncbi:MAG: hypothetical protein PHT77_05455 [Bacteroidales bacterium]|nr:hypothetical protein [Bacteroidales bacterium]
MGMYTELVFGARLKEDVPQHIVEMLKVMFKHNERLPEKYSDWNSKFPEIRIIPFGGSHYFAVQDSLSRLSYDEISKDWTVCIRCNIKNYDHEIQNFIDWITPYIEEGSGQNNDFLGYTLYEEDPEPKLLWLKREV